MKRLPKTKNSPVIRTDFTDDEAWRSICEAIEQLDTELFEFKAYVEYIEEPEYAGLSSELLRALVPPEWAHSFLFVVDRVSPSQTHEYQSYQLEVSPSAPWHPGQSLSLVWVPTEAGMGPDAPPHSVTCQFVLFGPYATQADAQADHSPEEDGATQAASAPPLTLSTDLTAAPPEAVAYTLPAALTPGYYVAVGSTDLGGFASGSSSWVVEMAV